MGALHSQATLAKRLGVSTPLTCPYCTTGLVVCQEVFETFFKEISLGKSTHHLGGLLTLALLT